MTSQQTTSQQNSSQKDSKLNKTTSGTTIFGDSYNNEKQKSQKGTSMLSNIQETNQKITDKGKLYDDLKDSKIELFYDIKEKKFEYKQIKIGENSYKHINDIGSNEIPKDEKIEEFINFFKEIEEKFKEYNNKNEFTLILEIKGDKYKIELKLDCSYTVNIHGKKQYYKDFDIINNGTSKGLEDLFYDLNNFDC